MFQPETSRKTEGAARRIRNLVFPNPRHRVPPALAQQATLASWWAMLGNPGTILVKAMPEGRGILERTFSDPHPKKIASESPERKKQNKLCLQRIAFQKPVFIVEPARCHVDLTSVPTHAENHPSAHKGEYISILEHRETLRNYRTVANKNTSLFLHCLPLTSWCFSHC